MRGQQERGEPLWSGGAPVQEGGDGLSVVKLLWSIKRNQVTVFYGLSKRRRNVCIGSGTVLGSQRSSREPLRGPQAGEGPGEIE